MSSFIGILLVFLLRFFVPHGNEVLIVLLVAGGLFFAAGWLGWLPKPAADLPSEAGGDAGPDPMLERIRFDSRGFVLLGRQGRRWFWRDEPGNVLGLSCAPGHLGPVEPGEEALVQYCRDNIRFGCSLVEAKVLHHASADGVLCIYKREQRPSYVYGGWIHVFLEHQTIVFWMGAQEWGITGVREATVTADGFRAGSLELDQTRTRVKGWFKDPYDAKYDARTVTSVADDKRYDERFPGHPLSRIRCAFERIERTFEIARDGQAEHHYSAFLSDDSGGSAEGPRPTIH
jgi:hypothetical protein